MEKKDILMSALGLGLGVGVGLGLASGKAAEKWTAAVGSLPGLTAQMVEEELMRMLVDGKESGVSFDQFPYYLSEQTRVLLISAAYVHLKQREFSKFTRNLSPASQAILLSGPAELYQQMLAKALAHYFEAKLLLLDISEFSVKMQNKYGSSGSKDTPLKRSISEATLERISGLLGSFSILPQTEEPKGSLRRQGSGFEIRPRGSESYSSTQRLRRYSSVSSDMSSLAAQSLSVNPAPLKRTSSWAFDVKLLIQSLYKVLHTVSKRHPIVLYIRDVEYHLYRSNRIYSLFQKMLKKLQGPLLILGSRMLEPNSDYEEVDAKLSALFPYNIEIKPPEDNSHLVSWKSQLEEDMRMIQIQDNRNHIMEVLAANDIECNDLSSICVADTVAISNFIEEIVVSAVSYHLMNTENPEYRNGKLVISSDSLSHGLSIFQEKKLAAKSACKIDEKIEPMKGTEKKILSDTKEPGSKEDSLLPENKTGPVKSVPMEKRGSETTVLPPKAPEAAPDNEFEKRIRPEVIPPSEIGVTFDDIGALDDVKESLQELVILPLRRPDLFKGGLLKPCRGILLFGPPGTGKTMLAKAIANEARASFINVSMSTIASKWFGEDEKNVRALFTLASKVSPTIIFVDEVDSMLGQRSRVGEHEAMRKIKNEFMTHWDGLLTKPNQRILVLAATNRPFDLDEAIIRRFERRIMVGLPSLESRELILKTLLSKENVEKDLDYRELATMTEGYTGSDLKNLCITAAYRPVRELIQKERIKEETFRPFQALQSAILLEKERKKKGKQAVDQVSNFREHGGDPTIILRPLNMEDLKQTKNQIAASFATEGAVMNDLKQWNELYGEGGSRKKQQLSYFL